jgi:hypothetical protein
VAALSRREALSTLREGQDRLAGLLAQLSDDELGQPSTLGGGEWSPQDLIGHMAAWEEVALVTVEAWLRGDKPPIEERFGSRETDEINARNQDRKHAWSLERIRADSEETHRRLVSAIEGMTEEEWASPPPFEPDGQQETLGAELGGLLGAPGRPFGHAFAHLPDLEAYVRSVVRR